MLAIYTYLQKKVATTTRLSLEKKLLYLKTYKYKEIKKTVYLPK